MPTTEPAPPSLPDWRRLPIGAEPAPEGGVHFRVWAPEKRTVAVVLEDGDEHALTRDEEGYFAAHVAAAGPGTRYRYRLDGGEAFPDPASRRQPLGPHGPSEVVDPDAYRWGDARWPGRALAGQVLYELHVGTFTPEGTWRAAIDRLPLLADVGITVIEMMPVAEFPGDFGWGYDGVALFAPARIYGAPDDLRAFVDAAHAHDIAVLLDVVYNHLGPDGNYLPKFAGAYFSTKHHTDWGEALNFDGERSTPVRDFVCANARYWVSEFHFDGLRLDATQSIFDDGERHVIADIASAVREAAGGRATIVVGENEPQDSRLLREEARGGCALDALWNDDWHHAAMVALTGRDEAYYADYQGKPQEFVSAAKYGFLYQGQWYRWQQKRRGTPTLDLAPARFIHFIQNHDQIANSGVGERAHQLASPARMRAMTALLLLGPQVPMLFMGQEFGASARFLYFADHGTELARLVERGRRTELSQFPSLALPEMQPGLAAPHLRGTFERCKLDWTEREANATIVALHRDLLRLRRDDDCLRAPRRGTIDGTVLGEAAFALRWFAEDGADRLLVVNLGRTLHLDPAPEPLLAPPGGGRWRVRWSSEDPRYGGLGTPELDAPEADRRIPNKDGQLRPHENWRIPPECAVLLIPERLP